MQYEVWPLIFNVQQIRYSSWFFHVKSLKIKVQGKKTIHMVIFWTADQEKGPTFTWKSMSPRKVGRSLLHYACLDVFCCHQKKRSWGNYCSPSRKRRIPFRAPFYSLFSIFPCICVPIWFYARVASRVIVKMNQEPLLLLSSPPVSL